MDTRKRDRDAEDVYASFQQLITFFEDVLNNIEVLPNGSLSSKRTHLQLGFILCFTYACFSPGSQSPTGNGGGVSE